MTKQETIQRQIDAINRKSYKLMREGKLTVKKTWAVTGKINKLKKQQQQLKMFEYLAK